MTVGQPLTPLQILRVNKDIKLPEDNLLFRKMCSIVRTSDMVGGISATNYDVSHPGSLSSGDEDYTTGGYASSPLPKARLNVAPVAFRSVRHMGRREDYVLERSQESRFEELRYNATDMLQRWYNTVNKRFMDSLFDTSVMYNRDGGAPGDALSITGDPGTYLSDLAGSGLVWQPLFEYLRKRKYFDYRTGRRRLVMVISEVAAAYFGLFYEFGAETLASGGAVRITRANMGTESVLAKMAAHLHLDEIYVANQTFNYGTEDAPDVQNPARNFGVICWADALRGTEFNLTLGQDNPRTPVCGHVIATNAGGLSPRIRQIPPSDGSLIESFFADGFANIETNVDVQTAFTDVDPGVVLTNFIAP